MSAVNDLVLQIVQMTPDEQYDLAFKVAENVGYALIKEAELDALANDHITWRPVNSAPPQERVLLYAPPEKLSDKPDQESEYRVARAQDFCWATLWMKIKPPIQAAPTVKRTTHG